MDIRKNSKTYGVHYSIELSGENNKQLWVPPGFLHGFLTLENDTSFTYKVSNYYDKDSEIGTLSNDADLNVDWNKHTATENLLLFEKI